jgi:glutamine amidotransferase
MITIVESGGANIASIVFALERLGYTAQLSCDSEEIKASTHVILPGVGSAEAAMRVLKKHGLEQTIRSLTQPVLGICLGMQVLFDFSEEGHVECLKIIPGKIELFPDTLGLPVPHMGWNTIMTQENSPLLKNIPQNTHMYFVHSYRTSVTKNTTAITEYGENFAACVQHHNFFGTQFHPERSGEMGAQLLKNFLELS